MTSKNISLDKTPLKNSSKNINMKRMNSKQFDKGNIGKFLKSNLNEKSITNIGFDKKQQHDIKVKNESAFDKLPTEPNIITTKSQKNIPFKRETKNSSNTKKAKKLNENMSSENISKKNKNDSHKRPQSSCHKIDEKNKNNNKAINNSFTINPRSKNKYRSPIQTEFCDFQKIEEKTLENSINDVDFTNTNNEELLITETVKNFKEKINFSFINEIEKKLDVGFKELKKEENNINYQTKKFNIVKNCFEQYLKHNCNNEALKLLTKFHKTYLEYINFLIKENNEIRENVCDKEKLSQKYNNLSKKLHDKCILLEEKNDEIIILRNKLKTISSKDEHKLIDSEGIIKENNMTEFFEVLSKHNEIIKNINKTNIDDLEAIYFFDRVDGLRSKSVADVPKLNLNFVASKSNTQTIQKQEETKKLVKNKTLEIVKQNNTSFKHDLIANNKKTYVPVKNSITLAQSEVFLDTKDMKNNKIGNFSTKSSTTSLKNEFKKLHNNK